MTIRIKLSTLFWIFVWPFFPFLGIFVAAKSNSARGMGFSLLLTFVYGFVALMSLLPVPRAMVVTDVEVAVHEGALRPTNVTVQHRPLIRFLPWSRSVEEKEYIRCEREEEIWWIEVATQKRIVEESALYLERAYRYYCSPRDQRKRNQEEAETIKAMLELAN